MARTKEATSAKNKIPEVVKVIKNFKANSDIEAFYRFVHEGDLRLEAGKLLKLRSGLGGKSKSKRTRKKKAKTLQ